MKLGWEISARPHRPDLSHDEWDLVEALGSTCIKVRPYALTPGNLAGIVSRNLDVLLRPDSDGDVDSHRAPELIRAIGVLAGAGVSRILVTVDSEPNHNSPSEPLGRPYKPGYWEAVHDVESEIQRHYTAMGWSADLTFVTPPLAVSQGEVGWYGRPPEPLGPVGVHVYGQQDDGLARRSLDLANLGRDRVLPKVACEVGDSSDGISPEERVAWTVRYLEHCRAASCHYAFIFILGSDDPQWSKFILTREQAASIGAAFKEQPMVLQTDIIVTTPKAHALVQAGSSLHVEGIAVGVDGSGMLTAMFAEDTREGQPNYAKPVNVRGIQLIPDPAVGQGGARFAFDIDVPNSTEGQVAASILLSTTELDAAAFSRGEVPYDAYQEAFPLTIAPVYVPPAAEQSAVPEASNEDHIQHSLMNIHFSAGDAFNRTSNPIFTDMQRAVAAYKDGKTFSWPQRP